MLVVATRRPSWSLAWATWMSRCVSTPTVTGDRSCAIVVIAVSFGDWLVDGTRAGWTDSTVMGLGRGRDGPSPGGSGRPPRRSQRAGLPHWAPALGAGVESHAWPWVHDPGWGQPPGGEAVHAFPVQAGALATAPQRLMPVPGRLGAECPDRLAVAGHGVVGAVPSHYAR